MVQTSIAWAIAAIPEGLPIVASIALSREMLKLAKYYNVVLKKLSAVETLGETTVIFTDKTGTLTENKLTTNTFYFPEERIELQGSNDGISIDLQQENALNLEKALNVSVFCNNASLGDSNDDKEEKGDPLEVSLLQFAKTYNEEQFEKLLDTEKIGEAPFNSETMRMGTVHKLSETFFVSVKGATEAVLDSCTKILKKGDLQELSEEEKEKWIDKNNEMANDGLRVLSLAYRETNEKPDVSEDGAFINEMVYLGLVGFIDPPREEVKNAVKTCLEAGIKVVLVTGDHPGTALNIGKQVNIVEDAKHDAKVIHGKDLDAENEKITDTAIFSRVDPSQKLQIIEHFQRKGAIVCMTGDGVNDAPALKKADIGIAMGKRGTQVAQEVSDMVLKDDSFPSIVQAIKQGRVIFGNIRKFVVYQLSYHLSEILVIAAISFTVYKLPLLPLQLLFLNLLSDVFPALALGVGEGSQDVMKRKPKDPNEPIITKENWLTVGVYGFILTLFVVGAYFFSLYYWNLEDQQCNNVAFFSLAFAQLWHVFNMRGREESFFKNQVTKNKYIWMALAFCSTVLIIAYFIPFISDLLSFQQLAIKTWGLILLASILPTLTIQLLKRLKLFY